MVICFGDVKSLALCFISARVCAYECMLMCLQMSELWGVEPQNTLAGM